MEIQKSYENENFSQNKTENLQENKEEKTLDERFDELNNFLKDFQEFNHLETSFWWSRNIFYQIKNENNISIFDKKWVFKVLEKYLQKNIDLKTNENNFKNISEYKINIDKHYLKYLQKWWQKINEIEKILDNPKENAEKIIEVYFLVNYFSFFEEIISALPGNKKQEVLENENNPNFNIINYFNENSEMFLENDGWRLYLYKFDKNFETRNINLIHFLPKNEFIEKIIQEKNLQNFKSNVYFFEPIPENSSWANPLWNDLKIFPKNIQNLEKYSKEERGKIINGMIANETMHILWENAWFENVNHDFSEILWKNFSNLPEGNKKPNINEFLSDYSSIRFRSKEEIKRITNVAMVWYLFDIQWKWFYSQWYQYSARFHWNLIKEVLWKNFSDYFQDFSGFYEEYIKLETVEEFMEFQEKYNFQEVSERIYQDLENKKIIYNWKEINWIEYLILKNQENWDRILEVIYQNLK